MGKYAQVQHDFPLVKKVLKLTMYSGPLPTCGLLFVNLPSHVFFRGM